MTRVMMKDNLGAEQSSRWYSPNIWGDCPIEAIKNGTVIGRFFQDDFTGPCPNTDAGLYEGAGESPGLGYSFYGDTGVTMKAQAGAEEGVLEVAANNADKDEGIISTTSPSFIVSDTAADAKKLWFEARVKKASITDEELGMFIGLGWDHGGGVSLAKENCLVDDTDNLGADQAGNQYSFLGFHVDLSDADLLDFVYQADSQVQTVKIAAVDTLETNTWVKVGFVYDPTAPASKKIAVFINNVKQTTYVTKDNIAAAIFPDAEPMAMLWATKVGESVEHKAQMDWWRAAQLG